jgi:hypothetical protein
LANPFAGADAQGLRDPGSVSQEMRNPERHAEHVEDRVFGFSKAAPTTFVFRIDSPRGKKAHFPR